MRGRSGRCQVCQRRRCAVAASRHARTRTPRAQLSATLQRIFLSLRTDSIVVQYSWRWTTAIVVNRFIRKTKRAKTPRISRLSCIYSLIPLLGRSRFTWNYCRRVLSIFAIACLKCHSLVHVWCVFTPCCFLINSAELNKQQIYFYTAIVLSNYLLWLPRDITL